MSVFESMSASADVMTNAISFLTIAYLLKLILGKKNISKIDWVFLLFLSIIISIAKFIYCPILLLVFAIPKKNFKNATEKIAFCISILFVAGLTLGMWMFLTSELYIPYSNYDPNFRDHIDLFKGADIKLQSQFLINHINNIPAIIYSSTKAAFEMYSTGFIGTLGWLDTFLPNWLIVLAYLLILMVTIFEPHNEFQLKFYQRILLLSTSIFIFILIILSQYLNWTEVGTNTVYGIMGRYLIPVSSLLFFSLTLNLGKRINIYWMVIPFTIFSLTLSSKIILERYYYSTSGDISFYCDAEKHYKHSYFETNNPKVKLNFGETMNSEKAHSGNNSAKLNSLHPYAFSYIFYEPSEGDSIEVETWRYKTSGELVLSYDTGKPFSLSVNKSSEFDSSGWEKLILRYRIPRISNSHELGVFVMNNSDSSAYFDDFRVSYYTQLKK